MSPRSIEDQANGAAARYEHYHDEESLQTYVRREVAPRVQTLLTRQNASWDTLTVVFLRNIICAWRKGKAAERLWLAPPFAGERAVPVRRLARRC